MIQTFVGHGSFHDTVDRCYLLWKTVGMLLRSKLLFGSLFLATINLPYCHGWGAHERPAQDNPISSLSRSKFCRLVVSSAAATGAVVGGSIACRPSWAFEGGVGGLGKTKPQTGVQFFDADGYSAPMQNSKGIVSAEIQSLDNARPIAVQFQTPWPLLPTTSGLEARDLQSSESAFVQVVPAVKGWSDRKVFAELLMNSVFAKQGKYSAYGMPTDVKVKPLSDKNNEGDGQIYGFSVSFTSLTPAMRESERQVWILPRQVDKETLVMLVVGTTRARFPSQQGTFEKVANSFQATAAPRSNLR